MKWYNGGFDYDGKTIIIEGTFNDSILRITANGYKLYEKPITLWAHQEIYANDILTKYEGMIRKCEGKIPLLVDSGIISLNSDDV